MFETHATKWPLAFRLMKKVCVGLLSVYLLIGMISAYRAWYQVASLDLQLSYRADRQTANAINGRSGAVIQTNVVSYARGPVDVRLELIQGNHAETIARQLVRGNKWGFFDPRRQQASQFKVLDDEVLSRFRSGRALLRATATGVEQWTRLPPPLVQELSIDIQRN